MSMQNIQLTEHEREFIEHAIQERGYASATEVMSDALRLLEQQQQDDDMRLSNLREQVQLGFDQLDRGQYTTYTRDTLHELFDRIHAKIKSDQ